MTFFFNNQAYLGLAIAFVSLVARGDDATSPPSNDALSISLPRIPALSIEQAQAALDVADGFRLELVAAEPLVVDPVAFCFDAQGRLLVIEMRDYSERPNDHLGRLKRLTDDDGDGRMDRSETMVEGLSWPTAVECWNGGVVIAAAPELLFISQDFKLGDKPQILATGFGRSNVQGLVNSLRWGLDLRLHGATSSSDSNISVSEQSDALRLGRRDFAIAVNPFRIEPTNGGGQHGMMIDPWGDKYACSNSDHLQEIMLTQPRAERSNRVANTPPLRLSIAADGPQADVFRLSPVEPWRILRTQLRVSGQVPGPVEGGGRAAGYFTGATGVYVYDGDQWPETDEPVALVCDVGSNLIHRKRLRPDGLWRRGERIDEKDEFLRSADIWFRPVQLGTGPDGALYIADMCREVIEHPLSLPPNIKAQLDLNSGNDRGRIWRVASTHQILRREPLDLDSCTTVELVKLLDHANGWQRRTAARLLVERQDASAVMPLRLSTSAALHAEGRVQALATLAALPDGLNRQTLDQSMLDSHPRVRQRAIELAASRPMVFDGLHADQIERLSEDPSVFVRFQLAYDASTLIANGPLRAQALATVANQNPEDPWIRWAIEGSLGDSVLPFADLLKKSLPAWSGEARVQWQQSIACQLVLNNDPRAAVSLMQMLDDPEHPSVVEMVATTLESISPLEKQSLVDWIVAKSLPSMTNAALSELATTNRLGAELSLLKWASLEQSKLLLEKLLNPEYSAAVQQHAISRLVGNDSQAIQFVVESLDQMTPAVELTALEVLASRREGLRLLIEGVKDRSIAIIRLPLALQRQLQEQADPELRLVLSDSLANRSTGVSEQVLAEYLEALTGEANEGSGQAVFVRICASCHRVNAVGKAVGPDLRSLVDKSSEQILIAVLDPNREVDPKYHVVNLETNSGRILAGILESETELELKIVDAQGNAHSVMREDLESLRKQARSLMPEGLHGEITKEQMRDLIAFLKSQPKVSP